VPSFTTPGTVYDVVIYRDNGWMFCTCMDCQCRRNGTYIERANAGEGCKHIRAVWTQILEFTAEHGQLQLTWG